MTDKNAATATQEALRSSLEKAQKLAKDSVEAGTDVVRKIQEALESVLEKSKVQSERSRDAALDAVATLLENAKKLAAETQEAGSDAAKEVESAIDKAIDTVRARMGGVELEAERPYNEWTRDELYAQAQILQIKGRTGMKKKDLIKALRSYDAA
jgi:hypothetical protein